jgi:hypothetical protein
MPPGFPGARPLSYDRAFVQRNTKRTECDRASRDPTKPDMKPSEGSALVHESQSAHKLKNVHDDCFIFR